jgi:hypothetical protein
MAPNFRALGSLFGKAADAAPAAAKVAQPASKGLQTVKASQPLARVSDDAAREIARRPLVPKKVAIGAGAIAGVAVLSTGALGSGCETLMGANNCQFITAPEKVVSSLTGLPAQMAEGVVFVAAGAFVIGSTYLASMAGNGWLTAGTFAASTFVAIGIVNRED